jgi:predicted secreted protein
MCGEAHADVTEHRLGPDDAGRALEVAAGDRVVIALPETPGTGFTWTVETLPPGVEVVGERYEEPPGAGIGGSSRHVFVLSAPGAAGSVRLRHGRPWTGEAGEAERYEVSLAPA